MLNNSVPYNLYNWINEIKFNKGFISKTQFEESHSLALKPSLNPPFGDW